jgi:plasmid stabilization system protein ParE
VTYRVVFTPEAEDHLDELNRYIADSATSDIAAGYVDAIITYCEGLADLWMACLPACGDPFQLAQTVGRDRGDRGRGRLGRWSVADAYSCDTSAVDAEAKVGCSGRLA